MSAGKTRSRDVAFAHIRSPYALREGVRVRGTWISVCVGVDGKIKWVDQSHNLVVNEGIDYIQRAALLGSGTEAQIGTWYVGLTAASPTPAAADVMSSHGGWTEVHSTYSQGTRPAWTGADTGVGTVSNSGSVASFSFTGGDTVGGCFLTSNNTKNGTTGKLYSVVAFTGGNRAVVNGDTLEVTYNFSTVDDGV